MNISVLKPLAKSIHFSSETMTIDLVDGRTLTVPLAYFPRLLKANPEQRSRYVITGGGVGLHWDELDEDISVEYLLMGYVDGTGPKAFHKAA
jgi:hypothetical protein